ncbi:SDR family oxidoreductase [Caulobacter segnis]|uniref:SDR family oxidoreductase n=1 Tax=Caulobacter segnis TaxID=88688 RepID=UPI00240F57A6|nr:SDR family oxidoreductase [Caulobacter segnis]MDG2520464.1 SDR family oxidoreductase [Caulobacter segnis]
MTEPKHALVIGGTAGIGLAVARRLAHRGQRVVITGRDAGRAQAVADTLGQGHLGLGLDLAEPQTVAAALAAVGDIDHLVLSAVERDDNSVRQYDLAGAQRAVTLKMLGYTAVVAAVHARLRPGAAIVVMGGVALLRPYPGSTTVSMMNGAAVGMARTFAVELAPVRVNVIHPGAVDGTRSVETKPQALIDQVLGRTPAGRLADTGDIAQATLFMLDCPGVNGAELLVDGGFHLC